MLECTDASAPKASGCWRYGVANVLSTTTRAFVGVRELGDRLDVDDRQRRIGRRLDPHHPGLVAPRRAERSRVAQVNRGPRDAVRLVNACDEPESAAVRVGGDDHVIARVEGAQHRVLRRESARERQAVTRALERRDARLERGPCRVRAPRVLVAAVLPHGILHEGRQADRRDDRTWPCRAPDPGIARVSNPSVLMRLRPPALHRPCDLADGPGLRICAWLVHAAATSGPPSLRPRPMARACGSAPGCHGLRPRPPSPCDSPDGRAADLRLARSCGCDLRPSIAHVRLRVFVRSAR